MRKAILNEILALQKKLKPFTKVQKEYAHSHYNRVGYLKRGGEIWCQCCGCIHHQLPGVIDIDLELGDPNRVPDMTKAKELFDFICENVQLPDVETDQLSNSLNGFTSMMERLSEKKKETQDKVNEAVGTIEGFVEGKEPVKEESEPTGEMVGVQTKEEAIPLPGSSPLNPVANNLRSILRDNKFKLISGAGANDYSEETFRLHGNGEYLDVTITFSTCPKTE